MMGRLDHLVLADNHIIAQVVEAEFIIGPVGDIAAVFFLASHVIHVALNNPDAQTQKFIQRPHPITVAPRQVIIDGHDMHAFSSQGV